MGRAINFMTGRHSLFSRRAAHTDEDRRIDRACLRALFAKAWASMTMNTASWHFVIVEDSKLRERLSACAKVASPAEAARFQADHSGLRVLGHPSFNLLCGVPTLIVMCARSAAPFAAADCRMAAHNLLLAARSMGLRTWAMDSATAALNTPDIKNDFGIPARSTVITPILIGRDHAASYTPARSQRPALGWH